MHKMSALLMQQLLGWEDAAGRKVQPLFRTVPISWCPAGGSDTHKKEDSGERST